MDFAWALAAGIVRDSFFWVGVGLGLIGIALCVARRSGDPDQDYEALREQPLCLNCRWPVDLCACDRAAPVLDVRPVGRGRR